MNRTLALGRLADTDLRWCLRLNKLSQRRVCLRYFSAVSRLGDGVFWYALMAMFPLLDRTHGWQAAAHMLAISGIALLLYRGLKHWSRRPRPLHRHPTSIVASVAPLDEFSFPSGHTLHAVSFTIVALAYAPWLAPILIPFALSVAASRVVLGLHYPSDVIAATAIGSLISLASLALVGLI